MDILKKAIPRLSLKEKISFSYSLLTLVILFFTLLATFDLCYSQLCDSIDDTLRNAAIMTAENPAVREALEKDAPSSSVSQYCDAVLADTKNLDIITICNDQGTRLYHKNKEEIGKHIVGGDEGAMLTGHENYFNTAVGTLGLQRRYFHAVKDPDSGQFLGFICVSVLVRNLLLIRNQLLLTYFIIGIIALFVSILIASKIHTFLLKLLLGYEPEQIANLIIKHQEVLDTLDEGLLAIDEHARISLLNSSAIQMLDITDPNPIGKPVLSVFPQSLLPRTLETRKAEYNVNLELNKIHLITSRIPVFEKGNLIGAVSIFRNHTEVIKLSEQLTGVNHMVDAMRAYTHEFTNKLHVILGLIQSGNREKAVDYIMHITTLQKGKISMIMNTIKLPTISALLIGKICRANELNIAFDIDQNSIVDDTKAFLPENAIATILGNLLENAMESIDLSKAKVREINLGIFYTEEVFFLTLSDSGQGIPKKVLPHIFEKGFSTKGRYRGTGLFLVKDLVESYHGDIQVTTEENNGTIFTVSIKNESKERSPHP